MAQGMKIAAQDVTWRASGVPVLTGVSFELEAGAIMACLGPNGAGKTTLLNILSGWTSPSSGKILIDGHGMSSLTPESASQFGIARRFDPPKLIRQLTVFENLDLAMGAGEGEGFFDAFLARRKIARAERAVSARAIPLLERLGIDDKLGHRADTLSVGEQKLLDLAIGLLCGSRCLILDEPLKDRVAESKREAIAQELRAFADNGGSILIVEHDLPFVRNTADRVLVLDRNGKVASNGETADPRTWEVVDRVYHRPLLDLSRATPVPPQGDAVKLPAPMVPAVSPRLSASGLVARYDGATVLFDASIELAGGEIAVLRGENGAGKSTLLYALAGLSNAAGCVRLDGEEVTHCAAHVRARKGIVLVAQDHKVFPTMTVRENLLVKTASAEISDTDALDQTFAWFPELRPRLGVKATHLSAGQQQMVALARAFLQSPRCLLLDEPTSGLDMDARERVRGLISHAAKNGAAVLIVEHIREGIEGQFPTKYFLKGGRLVAVPDRVGYVT